MGSPPLTTEGLQVKELATSLARLYPRVGAPNKTSLGCVTAQVVFQAVLVQIIDWSVQVCPTEAQEDHVGAVPVFPLPVPT